MEPDALDVWILAGQSNTVGDNATDKLPVPDAAQPMPGVLLAFMPDGAWRDARASVHLGTHNYNKANSVGPDMCFGRTLVQLGVSRRVGFVPTAKGATNLYNQWKPSSASSPGGLVEHMLERTRAALAAPPPGGGSCRLRGMIWVQGEADAEDKAGAAAAQAYAANFEQFVASVRQALAPYHQQLPIIMAVMAVRKRECFPYMGIVRQQQLALQTPGLIKLDMAGFEFFEEYGGFHVHLTKNGATAMGAAMAHAYALHDATSKPAG